MQVLQLGATAKVLDASNNALQAPALQGIDQLPRLTRLILAQNRLAALPDTLAALAQLKVLVLSSNRLTALPVCIGQLSKLETLQAGDNQLQQLPASIGQVGGDWGEHAWVGLVT